MRLTGANAIRAAENFQGVVLRLARERIAPSAARAMLRREGLSPSDLDLWADVSAEIYHLVKRTPSHTHHGPSAKRRGA